jgi:nicotinamide phosphoribosyltransferase
VCQYLCVMKDLIVANNVKLVVRPDSGEPSEVLPKIFQILQEGFGVSVNSKGFKVLNDGVKVLWGDGINETSCIQLFDLVLKLGFSADNLSLGSGGGLVQANIDRDTCKFAFKASAVKRGGKWFGIAKDPITDTGKRSKAGVMCVAKFGADYQTESTGLGEFDTESYELTVNHASNLLEPVYRNGEILRTQTIDKVRAISNSFSGRYDF